MRIIKYSFLIAIFILLIFIHSVVALCQCNPGIKALYLSAFFAAGYLASFKWMSGKERKVIIAILLLYVCYDFLENITYGFNDFSFKNHRCSCSFELGSLPKNKATH